MVSVVIPTYNGRSRIENTLAAFFPRILTRTLRLLSWMTAQLDRTLNFVRSYDPGLGLFLKLIGARGHRNRGSHHRGNIIFLLMMTVSRKKNWLREMLRPLSEDPEVVGVKGHIRSDQPEITARFVSLSMKTNTWPGSHILISLIPIRPAFGNRYFWNQVATTWNFPSSRRY